MVTLKTAFTKYAGNTIVIAYLLFICLSSMKFWLLLSCCGPAIDYFTVTCLVAWPLNESEAGGDFVLIETSLLFSC